MTEYICPKCGKEVIVEPMSQEEKDRMADSMLFYPSYNRRHYVIRCGCPGERMVYRLNDDAVFEEHEDGMKKCYLERDYSIDAFDELARRVGVTPWEGNRGAWQVTDDSKVDEECVLGTVYVETEKEDKEDERMTPLAILLLMILAHVIEDFHLQGRMAEMKQKEWWYGQFARISATQSDRDMSDIMATYGRDYVPVLLLHGVEWAICVTIPVMLYCGTILLPDWYCVAIIVMAMFHAAVDHMKCNLYLINLNADQAVHIAQVVALWMLADLI